MRPLQELVEVLEGLPPLVGCAPRSLRQLATLGRSVRLPAHWTVVHERTPGDTCYLVLDGEAEVLREGVRVTVVGPGALFGEAGALDRHLRNASVVALTPLGVLSVQCADLLALLDRDADLADRLLADYRRRSASASST